MTAKQARQLCQQAGAPLPPGMVAGDFEFCAGTRRKILDGISFRSTLEANVYTLLKHWERIGEIRNLECQPKYILQNKQKGIRAITYLPDFRFERGGRTVVIDAKGHRVPVYLVKVKLFRVKYPDIVFEEWRQDDLTRNGG